jgi:SAM-dependent methyltransferase
MSVTDSLGRSSGTLFTGTGWHYARYRPGYPEEFFADLVARFHLDGTGRLLDLGCGTGQLTIPLAEHVAAAIGMDPEPEMLAEAARQAQADRPFWRGPHPVTGRFLTYVEHSKECPTHEMADLLRANGMSDNEFAELGLILPKHRGNA